MKKQDILENQVNFAYLALGSNLGDKKNNLNKSIDLIQEEGIFIKKRSKFYSTKSWPNENFPNFINAIILIETKLNINELFLKIKKIEKKLGRTKSKRNKSDERQRKMMSYLFDIYHNNFTCKRYLSYLLLYRSTATYSPIRNSSETI